MAFAFGVQDGVVADTGWLHGLKLAAVAVVAHAVWSMAQSLTTDRTRIVMAAITTCCALLLPGTLGQLVPIAACGIAGAWLLRPPPAATSPIRDREPEVKTSAAIACLALFILLLILLPVIAFWHHDPLIRLADIGYRAGALVFGGGHVVLPMLHEQVVAAGLVSEQQFMAGYGAAQAVPGPLFTFAVYLGAVSANGTEGLIRANLILFFIFLPSYLLVAGVMPFWSRLRAHGRTRAVLGGVNASVVGLLFAALYDPVWTSAVNGKTDFLFVAAGFLLLLVWKCPPWLLVVAAAVFGWLMNTHIYT
jgi:chromate transporter